MISTMRNDVREAIQNNQKTCHSWSLHFDKFVKKEHGTKGDQLKNVCDSYGSNRAEASIAKAIATHWTLFQAMADEHGDQVRLLYFRNTSRLIVQMARSNILENTGMSFERISGMPMVNGTGVKGAVSSWAIWNANGDEVVFNHPKEIQTDRAQLDPDLVEIFGDNSGKNASAGKIVFYGLFPLEVPRLGIDILTPHQGRVLPNPFLVIEPGTIWLCPLRLMRGGDATLLDRTKTLLSACLTQTGLGAKTAGGYGRFDVCGKHDPNLLKIVERVDQANQVWKRQLEEANKARLEGEEKVRKEATHAKAEAERKAKLSPEDLAYEDYVKSVTDWTGPAREIKSRPPEEQQLILRFFRSPEGKQLLSGWTNKKGKKRVQNLKEEGL